MVLKTISKEVLGLLTPSQANEYKLIPFSNTDNQIRFYSNHNDIQVKEELEILLGKEILFEELEKEEFKKLINTYYRSSKNREVKSASNTSSSGFLKELIGEAKSLGSSDIHIESYENRCRVRLRIDGKLLERYTLERDEYPAFINKVKVSANLDIAEKRLPQDGRIFFKEGDLKFDIRVSVLPTLFGEKIVLRLLNNDAANVDLYSLGFLKNQLEDYLDGIRRPNGIILISGPTGSGKTTTLYATLKLLNEESRNITTIEDPIEYTLEGVNQVQLKENIGLDFAAALRTFLRQDPDVIMLGEIRDPETASMAVRASLTGHLVLSTIHTNSALDTISRLVDMGVPSYLISSTLVLSVAQRLVRRLCTNCKERKEFDKSLFPRNFKTKEVISQHFIPVGCDKCFHTGYSGRLAIYEVIPIDYEIAEAIKRNEMVVDENMKEKISFLKDRALTLFMEGETSIDEIYPYLLG